MGLFHLKKSAEGLYEMGPIFMPSLCCSQETKQRVRSSYVPLGGRQAGVELIVAGEKTD